MWNAIKSAASAIYNKIAPKAPAQPKGGVVKTFSNPNMGQLTGTGNPQSNNYNPQGSNYNPQGSNYNPQGNNWNPQTATSNQANAAQVEAAAAAERQRQALIRKQQAEAALNRQKAAITPWLTAAAQKAKQVIGAPKRAVDGIWNNYYAIKDRQKQLDDAKKQQDNALGFMDRRKQAADQEVAAAGKALANGDISPEQYNAVVQKQKDALTRQATFLNNDLQSRQDSINAPIPGKTNEWLRKATGLLTPIGKVTGGAWNVLSNVVEAPQRAMNTVWNVTHPGRPIENTSYNYKKPPTWSEWVASHGGKSDQAQLKAWQVAAKAMDKADKASQPKVNYSGSFMDRLKQAWGASKDQRVIRQDPYNKTMSAAGNLIADPINALPNEWGIKGLSLAAKAGRKLPGAEGFLKATGVVGSKLADTKIGRAASWLNKPINTGTNKYMQSFLDKANTEFKGLTPAEVQAYQDVMKNGGKVPAGYKMLGDGDMNRVMQLAGAHTQDYNRLYQAEKAAGLNYQPSKGYLPTRSELRDQASFLGLKNDAAPFFTRSKKFDTTYMTPEELAFARGYRGYASAKVRKTLPNQKFLSTDTSTLKRRLGAPNRLWKKAVLKYNPAWYVHNLGWNIPASFMAGGVGTAKGYAKLGKAALKERTLHPTYMDNLPKGVVDNGFFATEHGAGAGKLTLGTKMENFSRAAGFLGAKGQGKSDAEAIKNVNRTLFDYGNTKNWERPALTALPFWRFQKNITRLAATMPFTLPRWAKGFNEVKKNTMDKPYNALPDAPQQQFNPETGQPEDVNLKEKYKGKMKTPWGWTTNPFLPILPQNLSQVGVNPWVGLAGRAATGKDYFGKSVRGESLTDFLGSVVPQYRVGKAGVDLFNGNGNNVEKWLSNTGYSKEAQGIDPNKPNYKASLDPVNGIKKALRSFTGIPNFTPNFDEAKYRKDQNYYAFTKLYFGTDWYKQYPDFDKRDAARKELAKRFGFDLQKDLYDGKWSKYDSEATTKLKERKKAAIAMQEQVYKMYEQIPSGTGNNGARGKFIQMWKQLMGNTDLLDKNPDFMVFKNTPISGNKKYAGSKYAPSTAWGKNGASDGNGSGSKGSSAAKTFWGKYYSLPKDQRTAFLQANPQFRKFGSKTFDPKKADLTWAYKNLPPDVRRAYLNKKYGKASVPAQGWDSYLAERGMDFNSKLGRDLIVHPDLGIKQLDKVKQIVGSYSKPTPDTNKTKWLLPKRRASFAKYR